MNRILLITLAIIGITCQSYGQVGEVSKGSRSNKEKTRGKSGSGDGGSRGGSSVFFFLEIFDLIYLMTEGQRHQLEQRFDQPYRVSLEAGMHGGYYNDEGTFMFLPSIRGNWGLFSTHFRSNRMQDQTGQFQTLDWQVIQLNLVNLPKFTLRAGTGFSHVNDIDDTYHESTVDLEVHLKDRTLNPAIGFRWSNDYSSNVVPRLEINPRIDYQLMQNGKLRVSVVGGYLYQRYIGEQAGDFVPFHFIQSGLTLRFY